MPPTYSDDERVQGLHFLSVIDAAKAVAAALVTDAQARHAIAGTAIERALQTLATEVNRLSMFERRAGARGTVQTTEGADMARTVQAARSKADLTLEQGDAMKQAASVDAESAFDVENVLGPAKVEKPAAAPGTDDDLAVFDV